MFGFGYALKVALYSGKATVQLIEVPGYCVFVFYSKVRSVHEEALRLLKIAQWAAPVVYGFEYADGVRIRVDLVLYELKIVDLLLE